MAATEKELSELYSPAVDELVAIGAAIACNCEPCFKYHFHEALKQGVSRGDVALAVATARKVKEHIAEQVLKTAGEQLAAALSRGPVAVRHRLPSPQNADEHPRHSVGRADNN